MSLYRLIYSSQGIPSLQSQDLKDILESSQRNNAANGITGLLCYSKPAFLQVLEGEHEQVNQTYHRIVQDERHHTPQIIECLPIKSRNFEVWSMQAITVNDLSTEQVKTLVLRYSGFTTLRPNAMDPEQCLNFLLDIAKIYELSDNFFLDL
ncbi:BLUF domain-containing protein [Synechocystis sp. PCC 7339]|uniref:BLUF domain-containing protein n=1 Tax=Synechocystis TaxID=1142 RepID=UPI001880FDFE|nr:MULTISPECIES: BLUF domain-containing protein [Synechocystis]MBE9203234.1 BLUF domain-containing protein [Synechocystis salina LEGE 06099]QUS59890.1 BLUF domain-containing protein [Synechocystis sp. PCC 7338]UAJ72654.1 BLUF domain-containing protein [Synechocystis sp. PCC 7339]